MLQALLLVAYFLLQGTCLGIIIWLDRAGIGIRDPRRKRWGIVAITCMVAGFSLIPLMHFQKG